MDETSEKYRASKKPIPSEVMVSPNSTIAKEVKDGLIDDFVNARLKLHDRMELITDLLKTTNNSMMKKEVEGLEDSYSQMTKSWNSVKEHLTHEEAKKMIDRNKF